MNVWISRKKKKTKKRGWRIGQKGGDFGKQRWSSKEEEEEEERWEKNQEEKKDEEKGDDNVFVGEKENRGKIVEQYM